MKVLVTHINPHLDDIAAIWLFKKFNPEFKAAKLEFLSARSATVTWQNQPVDQDPEVMHFGIGKGKFDEHKGDLDDCATSLVWKETGIQDPAIKELVQYVTLEDTGKLPILEFGEFSLPAFIRPKSDDPKLSVKAVELGGEILDRILEVLKAKHQAVIDWEARIESETGFGKTIAVRSSSVDRVFCKSHVGDLFLMFDPKNTSVQYFTPKDIDLEPIYLKLKQIDPSADWFLHHSHHMVICGSGAAPDSNPTKLNFEQLKSVIDVT